MARESKKTTHGQSRNGCDSCRRDKWATIYYRMVRALSGPDKFKARWRYLCEGCWSKAEKGEI